MTHLAKISLAFTARLLLKTFPVFPLLFNTQLTFGQILDDFSDGDFANAPAWSGNTDKFTVDEERLRLTAPPESDQAWLSTPSASFYNAVWEFSVRLEFNPSSGNYTRVYLASDEPILSGPLNGYFVLIGDTPDEVSLYRQTGMVRTKIIDGKDGTVNASVVNVRVRVTRDAVGNWSLFSDTGAGFNAEDTVVHDVTHLNAAYFGFLCVYTATRSDDFYLDDIMVTGDPFIDVVPPAVVRVEAVSSTSLEVFFSEPVGRASAEMVSNYLLDGSVFPIGGVLSEDGTRVSLEFGNTFTNGITQVLRVQSVGDTAGNILDWTEAGFLFFHTRVPARRDVIITEFFSDPVPSVGLPETEFVEVYNRADVPFQLQGWRLADATGSALLSSFILLPGEHLIICPTNAQSQFALWGKTLGIAGFPSLNNNEDRLMLLDPSGGVVDSLVYSRTWYRDGEKEDGGYTLERINPDDMCRDELNWSASRHASGGTPGTINSVYDATADTTGPTLVTMNVVSPDRIELQFDERLHDVVQPVSFQFDPTRGLSEVVLDSSKKKISLIVAQPLDSTQTYWLTLSDVLDCPGNPMEEVRLAIRLDTVAPALLFAEVMSSRVLRLKFSERLSEDAAMEAGAYVTQRNGHPREILFEGNAVQLRFEQPFTNGVPDTLVVTGIRDEAGNATPPVAVPFRYFSEMPVHPGDVIINEIFADPAPPVGLPEAEYVELYNRTDSPFYLKGWKFTDGRDTATLSEMFLLPGAYVILSGRSNTFSFAAFGQSMALTTFPSLNNTGETLTLVSPDGLVIDQVTYALAWYKDAEKRDGGWSLERINPHDVCREGDNWKASVHDTGGTPGAENSVLDPTPDLEGPSLVSLTIDSSGFQLLFNERLSDATPDSTFIDIEPMLAVDSITRQHPYDLIVWVKEPFDSATRYHVLLKDVFDCPGNRMPDTSFVIQLDHVPPTVIALEVVSPAELCVTFSEVPDEESAMDRGNYKLANGVMPEEVFFADACARLRFDAPFENGRTHLLTITDITDRVGNRMEETTRAFLYLVESPVVYHSIRINEIMSDPSPVVALPEAEYVEIVNRSQSPYDLAGWKLADENGSAELPTRIMLPGEYLVLTRISSVGAFPDQTNVLGVASFPSLSNSGETIRLLSASGIVVDSVRYSGGWHAGAEKRDGGWSLEIIDPDDVCREHRNWTSSTDPRGGTPGARNSVFDDRGDQTPPKLIRLEVTDIYTLRFHFDEKLKLSLSRQSIEVAPDIPVDSAWFLDDSLTRIAMSLRTPLDSSIIYSITIRDIYDCPGNAIVPVTLSFVLDSIPPTIRYIVVEDERTLRVVFSEGIRGTNVDAFGFHVSGNEAVDVRRTEANQVRVVFRDTFANGVEQALVVSGVTDRAGNEMPLTEMAFLYFHQYPVVAKDVIITEIFADPSPPRALPEAEFVEVFNRSQHPFELSGWTLTDETSTGSLTGGMLLPGEYAILCADRSANLFRPWGKTVVVSAFPSLNNAKDMLVLKDDKGTTIDSLRYAISWYRDNEKADGGWSAEIIDPENLCSEAENWTASEDERGGTPGRQNSVYANKPDLHGPRLLSAFPESPSALLIHFDEKLHQTAPPVDAFSFVPALSPVEVVFPDLSLRSVRLTISPAMRGGLSYSLTVADVRDCAGNFIGASDHTMEFALPEAPERNDVVINEILFNPSSTGVDFVEVYNRSGKYLNLKGWKLAGLRGDTLSASATITGQNQLFAPRSFLVFTEASAVLKGEYIRGREEVFSETRMPSLPDAGGVVALVAPDGMVVDSLAYDEDMHSPFVKNPEGVSLERVSTEANTSDWPNWVSASATVGYATPGYVNSASVGEPVREESIVVEPEVVARGSSHPGFALIHYGFERAGLIANVRILDPTGREVKRLADNVLLGLKGFFRWDGDNNEGRPAPTGSYMVWFEIFDRDGMVKVFRKRVVVANVFK